MITITNELCLLHTDIDPKTNRGTAALDGYAEDEDGNAWELDAFVSVRWRRTATAFGKCQCGGRMICKAPKHPKANVRCDKCGCSWYLSSWLRRAPK